ncbi:MAG: DNA mismatch repair endonuclease MutL [Bacilli bacterium]
MGIIRQLDQHTTNLIAAGEVIERSSSVVKELVENSIDANATIIRIKLVDSGLSEISVLDNGVGMDNADAKLAIMPHTTSKIKDGNDLFKIKTLGFRGEALASIVSVSNFTLKTSHDGTRGTMYTLRGGNLISEAMISHPQGTEIIVKNLFFNTPARLQSVASQNAELSYVSEYVNKMALANPNISFTLINNNVEILKTYGNNDLLEVIMSVYKQDVAKDMISIFEDDGFFKLGGYTSKLKTTRSTKAHITIIVNGRFIKNSNIVNAVIKGYDEFLLTGKFPITILNIQVDPGMIDVNVHPAKLEIRFSNESKLLKLVEDGIRRALENTDLSLDLDETDEIIYPESKKILNDDYIKSTDDFDSLLFEKDEELNDDELNNYSISNDLDTPVDDVDDEFDFSFDDDSTDESLMDYYDDSKINNIEESRVNSELLEETRLKEETKLSKQVFNQQEYTFFDSETIETTSKLLPKMHYIGQLHGTYILAQAENMFFIIDQHAAAERVNYERILEEFEKEEIISYELLIPFKLDFTNSEAILINENIDKISKLGIKIEDFGTGSYMIREVPIWFKRGYEQEYVEEIITKIINNNKLEKIDFLKEVSKGIACKKSIKGNEYHSKLEIQYLLEDLSNAKNPYTCPHGRPVIVKFSRSEIEKWFKRIV